MGPERKSLILHAEEKALTAWHEAGHTLVGHFLPYADPIHKVTIIPRGRSLGSTWNLPERDKYSLSKEYVLDSITMLLAGRIATNLKFGVETNGASNDFERATDLARKMVCEWGMSPRMGTMTYEKKEGPIFLGRDFTARSDVSQKTLQEIDVEIRRIIDTCYGKAKKILTANRQKLEKLATALVEKEVLNLEDVVAVLGRPPKKKLVENLPPSLLKKVAIATIPPAPEGAPAVARVRHSRGA
jgi:cell division protease FtsH